MNIRCNYCRQSFNLSRDYLVEAVAKATEKGHKYHTVECINCRKAIKVSVPQMKQFTPETPTEDAAETES